MNKGDASLRIALIGYGKMGKAIEEIALSRGHSVVVKINRSNLEDLSEENLKNVDVAIEFTGPEGATENLRKCLAWDMPVVCGSTGWLDQFPSIRRFCEERNGSLLYASNFSIGVNIFFELNKYLAQLMGSREEYRVSMEEIHHTGKKDAPSGTAITLAEQIIGTTSATSWVNADTTEPGIVPIISRRIDPAPGTHVVRYSSSIDDIEIIHTAHSRKGFATGAILAAEFLVGKKGCFTMKDVLNL